MKKKLIILTGIILIAAGVIYFYLKNRKLDDFNALIKEKLTAAVIAASDSLYRLEFDSLQADVLHSRLIVENVSLIPDSLIVAKLESEGRRPDDVYKISLNTIIVEGINISDFTSNNKIDLDILYLKEPKLEIFHKKSALVDIAKDTASIQTLYQRISQQANRISVKKLIVQNMDVTHHSYLKNEKNKTTIFNKVNIVFDNILIDSVTQYDSTRFLYAKEANITLPKMKLRTGDSLYFINMDSISLNALKRNLRINNFTVVPRGNKDEFTSKLPYIKERYDINFGRVVFKNIDWWSIVSNESFDAEEAEIENGKLNVFADRSLPPYPKSKVGRYPHQLVMKSPIPLNVRKIKVTNLDLTYEEFNPKSGKRGKLIFNNINGMVTNITNDKAEISKDHLMKMEAKAQLMSSVPVKAEFTFDLAKAEAGIFSVDVEVGKFDATKLNPAAEPLGLFKIEKANVQKISAHVNGSDYEGRGTLTFLYDDLKITALKAGDNGHLEHRDFISFIANNLILKKSNPANDGKVRTETSVYNRDVHKSFFNLIWKTILIGILKTIGYEEGANKVK